MTYKYRVGRAFGYARARLAEELPVTAVFDDNLMIVESSEPLALSWGPVILEPISNI